MKQINRHTNNFLTFQTEIMSFFILEFICLKSGFIFIMLTLQNNISRLNNIKMTRKLFKLLHHARSNLIYIKF